MSAQMPSFMQWQAYASPPKMTAARSAWTLVSSTGCAAVCAHRGHTLLDSYSASVAAA
jgi:hypothetical protein